MSSRHRCTGIAVALLLIIGLCAGCGRKPRGASAQPPQVAVTPTPARPAQPAPAKRVEPQPVTQPEPAAEPAPEPVVERTPEPEPQPVVPADVSPGEYLALADQAADRGDCATAIEYVHRYRVEQVDNLMLLIREAGLAKDCGRPQQVINMLIDLDARTRAMEPISALLADAYLMMNQPAKAAMTWELRYIVDESALDAAVNAATSWLEAGVEGTARWWYEQAAAAAPDSPEVQLLATVFEPENDQ